MNPSEDLRVTLVQTSLTWEDKAANLNNLEALLSAASPETDVIILPEMFATGFSMSTSTLAELEAGETYQWMTQMASKFNSAVTGSVITKSKSGQYFNRLYWVRPDGSHSTYDKRHLFSFANEEKYYSQGNTRIIENWRGWKICPLVCYDLRFPLWSRNSNLDGKHAGLVFDVLLYVANWPEARRRPWLNLLEARAHENQVYTVGVNRIGLDGNTISYSGDSRVFSPKGEPVLEISANTESVETTHLSKKDMDDFRSKFTAWRDKDSFRLDP